MSLFVVSDYTTALGVTDSKEIAFVGGAVVEVRRYLASQGLIFYPASPTKTKKKLEGQSNGDCVFDTYYWQENLLTPVVSVKNISDGSLVKTLVLDTDYWVKTKLLNTNAVYQIETKDLIYSNQNLEIDAVWGFDIETSSNYLDLENAILGYVQARLMEYRGSVATLESGGRELSEKILGKISLNYKSSTDTQTQLKNTFKSLINTYL